MSSNEILRSYPIVIKMRDIYEREKNNKRQAFFYDKCLNQQKKKEDKYPIIKDRSRGVVGSKDQGRVVRSTVILVLDLVNHFWLCFDFELYL